ncbi:MAG: hypothetical protein ACRD2C_25280 [Acidimicrobiales bacterium]
MAADDFVFGFRHELGMPWSEYLDSLDRQRRGIAVPDGFVPATFLVADVGGVVVGRTSIRHRLNELAITTKGLVPTGSSVVVSALDDPLRDFKPKNDGEYVSHVTGKVLIKRRRHERLVTDFGDWAHRQGWRPSTRKHPIDLMLYSESYTWLVEAKVVYHGNAAQAVRACLGQLYEYKYFLFPDSKMVALFSEPIGSAFVAYLEACGIESVWWESGTWAGSVAAHMARRSKA